MAFCLNMKFNVCYFDILRRLTQIAWHKNSISTHLRSCFTTLSGNQVNYYDISDKRDLTESSAFEKNDQRRSWTNRDDSTSEDYVDTNDRIKPLQRSVATYRTCKVTNSRSKVNVAINSMDGDDVVSGICYNILGVESDMSLENLYNYLRNQNISRKLSMDHCVKILLLYDRLNGLSHEMRNLIQSYMYLNVHRFTPFQIIATFEVFGKHQERYENLLNLLCLIFYDHMIPLMKCKEPTSGSVGELGNVLDFLRVLKDFKFKKLTDVLYGHVYDNMESLSTDDMIEVSNTFFRSKKDANFVEMYTKMLSRIFKMPLLDLQNFENYVQRILKGTNNEVSGESGSSSTAATGADADTSNILLDDMKALKAIFNCNSEFLISSVHHRIEFKRLWRHNIETNNVSWKSQTSSKARASDYASVAVYIDCGAAVSYTVNFQNLYGKIEHLILNKFKFQTYPRIYVCNIIATVLDYSRYSNEVIGGDGSVCDGSKAHSILTNLYALLIGLKGDSENTINELKLVSPKTILDHSHVHFYKIDPKCEFYRDDQVNYYKPHLTTHTLSRGDHRLYSLLMRVFTSYMMEIPESTTKNDGLSLCKLIRNVIHPFYCSRRVREKPFLALDMLHMSGNLNKKSTSDFSKIAAEFAENIEKSLSNGLLGDLISFAEAAMKCVSNMLSEDFTLSERVQVLRTISSISICNGVLEQESSSRVKEYTDSTEYVHKYRHKYACMPIYANVCSEEDREDRLTVGHDVKLLDYISDSLALGSSDGVYELLRENLKLIYPRMEYFSLEELVSLSSCISSSLNHFSKLDLEGHENLESLSQTLKILKRESKEQFYSKSAIEEEFNAQTTSVYNFLMMYHIF
ncbi:conserved hypothetical protein [Theileria orientalis strain Shintoku]|uniref:Uncharacterized protein n=1 Tax=Theileria orientalis strain Shintoku TaxID=869250 RepID=J4DP95_THEOR|nr:conserved hypothetical protein [Theileria orientalis strain Shintoku]BAM40314.1 conserved hypothetical protein [Theileria orientalis strain Shintoku]|eukprot:XP_009690615.1 conserved hypothetical protein [Theileria orientalis strain Shintoku]